MDSTSVQREQIMLISPDGPSIKTSTAAAAGIFNTNKIFAPYFQRQRRKDDGMDHWSSNSSVIVTSTTPIAMPPLMSGPLPPDHTNGHNYDEEQAEQAHNESIKRGATHNTQYDARKSAGR